jgi:hypothetical protein
MPEIDQLLSDEAIAAATHAILARAEPPDFPALIPPVAAAYARAALDGALRVAQS